MDNQDKIFSITVEWVQEEAKFIVGRVLTDSELMSVKKGLEAALLFDIDTIFRTAIVLAVEQCNRNN
ncbi:MAG: hypothetical protein ACE5IR_11660 [bacterium]